MQLLPQAHPFDSEVLHFSIFAVRIHSTAYIASASLTKLNAAFMVHVRCKLRDAQLIDRSICYKHVPTLWALFSLVRAGVVVVMSEYPDKEELYLLRVQDPSAADSLRKLLHKPGPPPSTPPLEIRFNSKF